MIHYQIIEGIPEVSILSKVLELYQNNFDSEFPTNGFIYEVEKKRNLLFNLAFVDKKLIGYKVGYEKKIDVFYSWLGGVHKDYRQQGIASKLMKEQHQWLVHHQFKRVRTHTSNDFKAMLICNLKAGFDITGTNLTKKGELRLILQKSLTK